MCVRVCESVRERAALRRLEYPGASWSTLERCWAEAGEVLLLARRADDWDGQSRVQRPTTSIPAATNCVPSAGFARQRHLTSPSLFRPRVRVHACPVPRLPSIHPSILCLHLCAHPSYPRPASASAGALALARPAPPASLSAPPRLASCGQKRTSVSCQVPCTTLTSPHQICNPRPAPALDLHRLGAVRWPAFRAARGPARFVARPLSHARCTT